MTFRRPANHQVCIGDQVMIPKLVIADTFWTRAVGLLGQPSLPEGMGLWIRGAASIHTVGMKFSIDLIFLDRARRVVATSVNVPPGRMRCGGLGADSVIEVQSGWLNLNGFTAGALVEISRALPDTHTSGAEALTSPRSPAQS